MSCAIGSPGPGTANSTRACTSWRSPKSAVTPPGAPTTSANAPRESHKEALRCLKRRPPGPDGRGWHGATPWPCWQMITGINALDLVPSSHPASHIHRRSSRGIRVSAIDVREGEAAGSLTPRQVSSAYSNTSRKEGVRVEVDVRGAHLDQRVARAAIVTAGQVVEWVTA